MKILVTGIAGFIGSHLAEALQAAGHEVIGIDNFNTYYPTEIKRYNAASVEAAGCKIIDANLSTDDLNPYLSDINVVYHCAAQPGISSRTSYRDYVKNNLDSTQNLLTTIENNKNFQLFVNIGTSSIYGLVAKGSEDIVPSPISYYGVTKLAAEQLALARFRDKGLPVTSLRLFSVYGPRERPDKLYPRLIHSIIDNVPFPLFANSLKHTRSFTYVGDVIKALMLVLEKDACIGEIINIGTTESITTGEAIKIVEDIIGAKANFVDKPPRIGDQKSTATVVEKAQRILGYHPETSFTDGITEMIKWFEAMPDDLRQCYDPPI